MASVELRVVQSALWAAYGDALGFISELTDDRGLRSRLSGSELQTTSPWRRRVGGRFGADVVLPAGCYSDDTQLRLATSRAIRGTGVFDIEAFTKVELPVWLSYQLGGGRGTKAAAAGFSRRSNNWLKNFFEKPTRYIDSGGNGAAMRIQPHVWAAAPNFHARAYTRDVLRNSITTHGHPRGFLGAVLHANLLAAILQRGEIPEPSSWLRHVATLSEIPAFIGQDDQLSTFWLPVWESTAGRSLSDAIETTVAECIADVRTLATLAEERDWSYRRIIEALSMFSPEHRGSGTRTVLVALALSWQFRRHPREGLREAALMVGSDTDSIATVAGAFLGGILEESPPGPVMDDEYIREETMRLSRITSGKQTSFVYPNLLRWTPPSSVTQAFGIAADGRPGLLGLGRAEQLSEPINGAGKAHTVWQWVRLEFGQTILVQRKANLGKLPASGVPQRYEREQRISRTLLPQEDLFATAASSSTRVTHSPEARTKTQHVVTREIDVPHITVDEAATRVLSSQFDPKVIGEMLLAVSHGRDFIERACGFAAIVAKARAARLMREENFRQMRRDTNREEV